MREGLHPIIDQNLEVLLMSQLSMVYQETTNALLTRQSSHGAAFSCTLGGLGNQFRGSKKLRLIE